MPRSKGDPSTTKANREEGGGGARKSQKTVFCKQSGKEAARLTAPAAPKTSLRRRGLKVPRSLVPLNRRRPTRPRPQLRAARRAPPVAAHEWSSPWVATTPFSSSSCSSCPGSSAGALAVAALAVGERRGAPDHQLRLRPGSGRPLEIRTRGSRLPRGGEDPGWGSARE